MTTILDRCPAGSILAKPHRPTPPPDPTASRELRQTVLDSLLPGQRAVCDDTTHRTVAFVAGLGAGKTRCLAAWVTLLAIDNPGTTGAAFAPTGPLVRDVVQRSLVEFWEDLQIPYTYRASPLAEYSLELPGGATVVLCRSMENWSRIIGMNLSFIGCDEIDTTKTSIARLAVQRFFGRLRAGDRRQLGLFSTPEGFGLLYSMFVEEGDKDDRALYRGKTADNPYLPDDYLESLLSEYPANLVKAYTEGEFVSMAMAAVYPDFDRNLNISNIDTPSERDTLWVGIDLNVERSWLAVIIQHGADLHLIREHICRDTQAIIALLKETYGGWIKHQQLIVCPDASARNRDAQDAGISSIGMMKRAGLRLQYQASNPFIKDRVLSLNAQILNGLGERHMRVHPSCKGMLRGLEQHSYDLNTQQPTKGDGGVDDLSGQMDALGYVVWQLAGIKPWITGGTRVEVW
jgi:hypothetical protein